MYKSAAEEETAPEGTGSRAELCCSVTQGESPSLPCSGCRILVSTEKNSVQ